MTENLGVKLSQPTISRNIRKMKFTRKRLTLIPMERNTPERIDSRDIYASEILMIERKNLIFLDETGFNQYAQLTYGYSQRNRYLEIGLLIIVACVLSAPTSSSDLKL